MKTVSIGIAAYNAEKNIKNILEALLRQKTDDYIIKEIVVHSDQSTDKTVEIVRGLNNDLVKVLESQTRKGFVGSVISLFNALSGDIVLLLNDDIVIEDDNFVSKIVKQFSENEVGMVGGTVLALPPVSFIDNAIQSTQRAYHNMRTHIRNGHNILTVDGKIMAVSSQLKNQLKFPDDLSQAGNVDSFIYMSCIKIGFKYRYAKDAVVYFRNPTNFKDYVKWTSRNNSMSKLMAQLFGQDMVDREYAFPKSTFLYYSFLEFIKNPIGCLFILATRFYINRTANNLSRDFNPQWETIKSSKNLS